ncbi:GAF domain-containing protein [bacterium]|nr:GAF domain-containing protein [bacterium]
MQELPQHWIGFYFVRGTELVLGPFQGPVACTLIQKGKGVCGSSWESGSTIVVDNVHEFEGHIACSPYSNSEIVIPCFRNGEVWAVLDIDSSEFSAFDEIDSEYLQKLVALL